MQRTGPTEDAERSRKFPSTHWSSIARVVQESKGGAREELANFVGRYLPVLRTYLIRGRGLGADEADECLQGFVADKIVEKEILARADPHRGRLRNFLLATLNNYLFTIMNREKVLRLRHKDLAATKSEFVEYDPAIAFNLAWAQSVVAEAVSRMKEDCAASKRSDIWKVFEQRIYLPARAGVAPTSYEVLVRDLNLGNPVAASNLLITAKRTFARVLRATIAEYAIDAVEVESEITDLKAALAQAESEGSEGEPGLD